jgi:hypothetical protein
MRSLVNGLGRVFEITAAMYFWLLTAAYVAAVVVGFVLAWWAGLVLLIPAMFAYVIWEQS